MKRVIVVAILMGIGVGACRNRGNVEITKGVTRKGESMEVTVSIKMPGKDVHYDTTFSTAAMSREQQDSFLNKLYDSLGVGDVHK